MPRRRSPPRLYLDKSRGQWIIRDGQNRVRLGLPAERRIDAEKRLAEYLAEKHKPETGPDPLVVDVLNLYWVDHLRHQSSAENAKYGILKLGEGFDGLRVSQLKPAVIRAFGEGRTEAARRQNLECLRAAIRFYHKHHGPLQAVPAIILPTKPAPRTRWLTRKEAARLLHAARHVHTRGQPSVSRFIILGLYTGSRSNTLRSLRWKWIDLERGIMHRRDPARPQPRNKKYPPVRLGRRLLSHLRRWRRIDPPDAVYVCEGEGHRPFKRLGYTWTKVREAAGLDDAVNPHTLRHTRVTWLLQAGVGIWETAGFVGMSPQTVQAVYGHHAVDYQQRASEL